MATSAFYKKFGSTNPLTSVASYITPPTYGPTSKVPAALALDPLEAAANKIAIPTVGSGMGVNGQPLASSVASGDSGVGAGSSNPDLSSILQQQQATSGDVPAALAADPLASSILNTMPTVVTPGTNLTMPPWTNNGGLANDVLPPEATPVPLPETIFNPTAILAGTAAGDTGVGTTPAPSTTGGAGAVPATDEVPPIATPPNINEDYLKQYLEQAFGSGRSFDPMAKQITGQRDDALRAMSEKMASRGLGNSGALAMGAGDIYSGAADQLGSAYQGWREQGMNDMKSAIMPYYENQMAEKLIGKSADEKERLMESQLDLDMRKLFGEGYDKNKGTANYELMAAMLGKGEPGTEVQKMLEEWFRDQNPALTEEIATPQAVADERARYLEEITKSPYVEGAQTPTKAQHISDLMRAWDLAHKAK